ncbi:DUF423 domain-containing protein [Candidatus Marinarcus aquaticus]|uniref:DUF423 domain-containing protein n=1 Tax=Candidatus Marinarcus aquaticus TaxID=2044504 RepID=A0A4Q0XRD4_9BACT|nr:DUF423 domain-containing protein [Candidatus Marinarcus aquaticus]RXJ59950.1 DUF423 domain-containing protein [Candidatus Marinarcus aquaticus]
MNANTKKFLILGSLLMPLAIGFGAFGAHGLRSLVSPEMLKVFHTGVEYQFYHALGMFVVAFCAHFKPEENYINIAGILMLVGVVIFSFSLYFLVLFNVPMLGMITPIGGVTMIIAWIILLIGIIRD